MSLLVLGGTPYIKEISLLYVEEKRLKTPDLENKNSTEWELGSLVLWTLRVKIGFVYFRLFFFELFELETLD